MDGDIGFFAFFLVACLSTYFSYTREERNEQVLCCLFSALFWIASLWQWFATVAGDTAIIGFVFIMPLFLNVLRLFEVILGMDTRYGSKADPFMGNG
jgi:hypothetical protein